MNWLDTLRLFWNQLSIRHPRKSLRDLPKLREYISDFERFKRLSHPSNKDDFLINPILGDKNEASANLTYHYFYQDLWMAQQVFNDKPERLIDVGSRVDGFVAHIASFRSIDVLDIRDLTPKISNVTFRKADIMGDISDLKNTTDAVSSLHVIEHLGLGRYGDPIDPNGHTKGLDNILQMLKKDGTFYFSVPFGNPRIEFNAHRVFSLSWLFNYLQENYSIQRFAIVDGSNNFTNNITISPELISSNANQRFGCALFVLRKR
jgi:hypothetical protein